MTTEERLSKLEKEIQDIRLATDVQFTESLRRRVVQDVIFAGISDTTLLDLNETTAIPIGGGGSVLHTEPYDKRLRITVDGTDYFIGLYNVS